MSTFQPIIGIIAANSIDMEQLSSAVKLLEYFDVSYEAQIISPHITPTKAHEYATSARNRGLKVIIAASSGAAHLAGLTAALSPLPVLGVPLAGTTPDGIDSLLSTVQMPGGVPVGTLPVGQDGATNAALLAVAILSLNDEKLQKRYTAWRTQKTEAFTG